MATATQTQNVSRKQELREDKVITFYARALEYFENHRGVVYGVIAGIVLLVLAIIGYSLWRSSQNERAQEALAEAVRLFEQGQYRQALDDAGDRRGLLSVADDFGSTKAGNLAHFYAGNALFQLGEYDAAAEHFRSFSGDAYLKASALAGEAAVFETRGDYARAADRYRDAAGRYDNESFTPGYLLAAARNYIEAGNFAQARAMLQRIENDYTEAPENAEVEFFYGRMEALEAQGTQG